LLFYTLQKVCSSWIDRLSRTLGFCGAASAHRPGTDLQRKLANSRLGAAVISSLAEFQEVQIYFIASIQMSTVISFNRQNSGTGSSNNNSFRSAVLNSRIATLLGISGVPCILLVQYSLHRIGIHWWYTFLIMTITYLLSIYIVVGVADLEVSAGALWDSFKREAPLPSCGGNPSPMTLCSVWGSLSSRQSSPKLDLFMLLLSRRSNYFYLVLASITWAQLCIQQIADSLPKRYPAIERRLRSTAAMSVLKRVKKSLIWRFTQATYCTAIQTLLIITIGGYISSLRHILVPAANVTDGAKWSFGQLIAVTVWAPTIVKFIYFNVCKC
jgi:hypothetical protein